MPRVSSCHCASVLDGLVYIVGAGNDDEVVRFDPLSGAWITLAPTLIGSWGAVTFVLGGNLYAAGGLSRSSSVERYDVAGNKWTAMADML
jgi:hypothetical protein